MNLILRRHFSTSLTILGILIVMFSCMKDDDNAKAFEQEAPKPLDFVGYRLPADSVFKTNATLKRMVSEAFPTKQNTLSRTIASETLGFSIDTTFVQILRSDTYDSYTFIVERESPNANILENYVLTYYGNARYTQFLVSYPFTINNDGEKLYDISNATASAIEDSSLMYRVDCVVWAQEWQPGQCFDVNCGGSTGNGQHGPGDQCNALPGDQPYSWCNPGTWVNTTCIQHLSEEEGGGAHGPSTGGTNTNTNEQNEEESDESESIEFPTVPVDRDNNLKKNCQELNKLTSPPAYNSPNPFLDANHPDNADGLNTNTRLAIINAGQELDNDVEHGFGLYNQGNFPEHGPYANHVPASNGTHSINFPAKPHQFGTVHTHPANSTLRSWVPMFSLEDIYVVLTMRNLYTSVDLYSNNNPNGDALFTSILVVKQQGVVQTYAIKIDNVNKLQNLENVKNDRAQWEILKQKVKRGL